MATILIHPTLLSQPLMAAAMEQEFGLRITVTPNRVRAERRPAPRRPTSRSGSWLPTGGDAA